MLIHHAKKIPAFRQTDQFPQEVWDIIVGYIAHPTDYFNIRSTCSSLNKQLPGKFMFLDMDHVKLCEIYRGRNFRNIGLLNQPGLAVLRTLVYSSDSPLEFLVRLFASVSDSEFEELPLTADDIRMVRGYIFYGRDILPPLLRSRHRLPQDVRNAILLAAVRYGCDEANCVEFILRYGLESMDTSKRQVVLFAAIDQGYNSVIMTMQQLAPIDLNFDFGGVYPLFSTCLSGRVDTFITLVTLGACPRKVRYRHGLMPLVHVAALRGDLRMLIALRTANADFDDRDFYGSSVSGILRGLIRSEKDDSCRSRLQSCYNFVSQNLSYSCRSLVSTVPYNSSENNKFHFFAHIIPWRH